MEYKYTGIVLNKRDIGETDRLYNIYTLEQGKITVMARGVRKSNSKLAGKLENFYLIDFTVMKNRGMGNIASSIVENNFSHLRNNFDTLETTFNLAKTLNRLINDEEKDIEQGFVFKLLDLLGYKIEVKKCIECGKNLSADKNNFFNYAEGGIVCGNCASNVKNIMSIDNNSIKIIRIFFQNNLQALFKLRVNKKDINEIKRISKSFIVWVC